MSPPSTTSAWPVTKRAMSEARNTTRRRSPPGRRTSPSAPRQHVCREQLGVRLQHLGVGAGRRRAGADRVAADALLGVVERRRPAEVHDARLEHVVGADREVAGEAADRRRVDDRPALLPEHQWERQLRRVEVRRDTDVQRSPESLEADLGKRAVLGPHVVVVQHVEPPELLLDECVEGLEVLGQARVGDVRRRLTSVSADRRFGLSDASSASISTAITWAPCRAKATAVAAPMPEPAPVTTATLSFSSTTASCDLSRPARSYTTPW